jgi:hypothetical protein
MILTIFILLTWLESFILFMKAKKISKYHDYINHIGIPPSEKLTNFDKFLLRLYNNYTDIIWVLLSVMLFINLIASIVISSIIYVVQLLITL